VAHAAGRPWGYRSRVMYWPLIGGFIAFLLIAVLLGWILDPARHRDAGDDRH
jgi:hypothetical protein